MKFSTILQQLGEILAPKQNWSPHQELLWWGGGEGVKICGEQNYFFYNFHSQKDKEREREERGDRRERMNNDKKRRHTNTNQGKANIVMKILK